MLSIKNLTHTYPNGVQALRNVNIDIPKGMFGLLGPNGAGKSSLMRTIATLQQPTSGSISFGDTNVLTEPDAIRRTLGYLPQDFGVYPRGSAYDLLDHLAVLKGITNGKERKQVVEGLLVQTNLFEVRKKKLATFSGGMRQRFGIAQALIGQPQLIIVDEPTAGLDPEERNRFHNLLSEIGEDVVVILSTHIVDDVSDLCPNMAVMAAGQIVSQGTPADLTAELDGKIWKKVIDKTDLEATQAEHNVISNHLSVGKMVIRVNSSSNPGNGFEQAQAHLEDVYFSSIAASRGASAEATDDATAAAA
ncbi:MAG: multidrug ABC transporter ATP-binding protein [Kordiimonadales bacterium]|nr:MAG: multidrug ABC transporter ATP-binding protein [Kordiimonadales bacterium]